MLAFGTAVQLTQTFAGSHVAPFAGACLENCTGTVKLHHVYLSSAIIRSKSNAWRLSLAATTAKQWESWLLHATRVLTSESIVFHLVCRATRSS